jgi:hypothetical protein
MRKSVLQWSQRFQGGFHVKRFLAGLVVGLVLATTATSLAVERQVRLFVNGEEVVFPEAPPRIIDGRTMVPARPLAEALGAKVDWDGDEWIVLVEAIPEGEWQEGNHLFEHYGVNFRSDGFTVTATGNGVTLTISTNTPNPVSMASTGVEVRGRVNGGRLTLNVDDLEKAGLIKR